MADSEIQIKFGADVSAVAAAAGAVKGQLAEVAGAAAGLKAAFSGSLTLTQSIKEAGEASEKAKGKIVELASRVQTAVKDFAGVAKGASEVALNVAVLGDQAAAAGRHFAEISQKASQGHGALSKFAGLGVASGKAFAGIAEGASKGALGFGALAEKAAGGATSLAGMIPGWGSAIQGAVGAASAVWNFGKSLAETQGKGSELSKAFEQNDQAMASVKSMMADALAPAMTKIVEGVNKLINGFVRSYKEGGFVKTLFDGLTAVVGVVVDVVSGLVGWIGQLIQGLIDSYKHGGAMKSVMDALGVVFNVVREIVGEFVAQWIMRFQVIRAAIDLFAGAFAAAFDGVKGYIRALMTYFKTLGVVIKDVLTLNWGAIAGDIKNGLAQIKDEVIGTAASMGSDLGQAAKKAAGRIATGIATADAAKQAIVKGSLTSRRTSNGNEKSETPPGGQDGVPPTAEGGGQSTGSKASSGSGRSPQRDVAEKEGQDLRQIALKHLKWRSEDEAEAAAEQVRTAKKAFEDKIALNKGLVEAGKISGEEETAALQSMYDEQTRLAQQNAEAAYQAENKLLEEKRALYKGDANAVEDVDREISQLRKAHEAELKKLAEEGAASRDAAIKQALDAEKKLADQRAQDAEKQKKAAEASVAPWVNAVSQGVQGMIKGTETLQSVLRKIGQQILDSAIKWIEKTVTTHVAAEFTKTAATVAGAQQRSAAEQGGLMGLAGKWLASVRSWLIGEEVKTTATTTAVATRGATEEAWSIKSLALSAATALKRIANEAAGAAAATYHSIASMGPLGPFLAPAAAAAAFGAVLAFGKSIFSAEGGWGQVPYDGALTELHKDEMVLPASIARPLRDSLGSGAANSNTPSAANDAGGAGGDQFHLHIHAMDGASVERVLLGNSSAVRKAMEREYRALRVRA